MATKVHMEALSPTMEEGQIVQWLKAEGDAVTSGEILAEIETDKATMELVARGSGVLRRILLPAGGVAPIGEVIAVIAQPDEDISALVGSPAPVAPSPEASPETRSDLPDLPIPAPPSERSDEGDRIRASPVARRLAESAGLELQDIQGSGPGGRIIKRDVEAASLSETPSSSPAPRAPSPGALPEFEDVPLTQIRKTIAKRLVESIGPVPHFFLTMDVDMTRAVEAREQIHKRLERSGVKISYNDILLKVTALALARHPECNAHWRGDHIRRFHRVHLSVAVAIEDGLITPVIRDADQKGLVELSQEVRSLAARAREKRLKPEEYTGGTFSVSNLGMFGIEAFTAVINPPEAGILAIGAMESRPVVWDGEVAIRPRLKLTLSCDHRVIDGAQGSAFLQTLKGMLEEPMLALL
jgi:pyruvate dehydrogenase E2 component (dihydrolipoamide acetyltransferase)